MAEKSVIRRVSELDPMFFIPEGAEELRYSESEISENFEEDYEEAFDVEEGSDDESFLDVSDLPDVPDILRIESQTIRRDSTGTTVVDVVLLAEDVSGVEKYDVRVTKI